MFCGNAFANTTFFKSASFTAEGNSQVTINTNGSVAVNEDDHTLTNSATFDIPTGTQVTFGATNASINGGINDYVYVTNSFTGNGGGSYSSGFYWFPDVDSNHGSVETSKTDSTDATDIDTNGGGYITSVSFNGSWQLSSLGNGVPNPTNNTFEAMETSDDSVSNIPMGCPGGNCYGGTYVSSYVGSSPDINFTANGSSAYTAQNSFSASSSTITETVKAPNDDGGTTTYTFSNS